jgi:hypothetical protein
MEFGTADNIVAVYIFSIEQIIYPNIIDIKRVIFYVLGIIIPEQSDIAVKKL